MKLLIGAFLFLFVASAQAAEIKLVVDVSAELAPIVQRIDSTVQRIDALEAKVNAIPPGTAYDDTALKAEIASLRQDMLARLTTLQGQLSAVGTITGQVATANAALAERVTALEQAPGPTAPSAVLGFMKFPAPDSRVNLIWTSENVDKCVATGAWSGEKPLTGAELLPANSGDVFIITCTSPSAAVAESQVTP